MQTKPMSTKSSVDGVPRRMTHSLAPSLAPGRVVAVRTGSLSAVAQRAADPSTSSTTTGRLYALLCSFFILFLYAPHTIRTVDTIRTRHRPGLCSSSRDSGMRALSTTPTATRPRPPPLSSNLRLKVSA